MNHRFAEAVISTFREDSGQNHFARLSAFDDRDWIRSYGWLDASGVALYLLERLKSLNIENAVPVGVLERLNENLADNKLRTNELFAEFIRINKEFERAGFSYVTIKGFSLTPDACPEITSRCQLDLDFLMAHGNAQRCVKILEQQGYLLTAVSNNVWEFKAGAGRMPSVHDLYKPKAQRSLEVEFIASNERGESYLNDDRLLRTQRQMWNGFSFPVLLERDKFLTLALHLFKHLLSEWTRVSWVLEFARYIRVHQDDELLWQQVMEKMAMSPQTRTPVGVAILLANRMLGSPIPSALEGTVKELPEAVRLWVELYERDVLFTDFPGTKLYLLLQKVLHRNKADAASQRRRKLFPIHRPPSVIHAASGDGIMLRMTGFGSQARFVLFRLWFHVRQSIRYMIEAGRWRRILAGPR
jgi:hypothetical protein